MEQGRLVAQTFYIANEGEKLSPLAKKMSRSDAMEYVKEYDPETGKRTTEKISVKAWDDVFGEIVPIEEWFPETIWVHSIDEIHRCFRVREMTIEAFMDNFKK